MTTLCLCDYAGELPPVLGEKYRDTAAAMRRYAIDPEPETAPEPIDPTPSNEAAP